MMSGHDSAEDRRIGRATLTAAAAVAVLVVGGSAWLMGRSDPPQSASEPLPSLEVRHQAGPSVDWRAASPDRNAAPGLPFTLTRAPRGGGMSERAFVRPGCFSYDYRTQVLRLRLSRGATLSDLAVHFGVTQRRLLEFDRSMRRGLQAGRFYRVPTSHLEVVEHDVRPGDTLGSLAERYDVPSKYSIRTWNCLYPDIIQTGDRLLFLRAKQVVPPSPRNEGDLARPYVRPPWR